MNDSDNLALELASKELEEKLKELQETRGVAITSFSMITGEDSTSVLSITNTLHVSSFLDMLRTFKFIIVGTIMNTWEAYKQLKQEDADS